MENLPVDYFVNTAAYTQHVYRDQYPAIDPTSEALSQAGKVVIITGASAGIGARGTAPAFAKAGAKAIVLIARGQSKLEAVAKELRSRYPKTEFLPLAAAVNDQAAVEKVFAEIKAKYGHADVLVNNAGVWISGGAPIESADPPQWWEDFEINVKGAFLMTQNFLKLLGKERRGYVVTMNTGISTMVAPNMSSYSISKSAALRLMEYVAAEHENVTATSIQPGVVLTDMVIVAFKRFALDTPELVGGSVVWLSTEAAHFLSGRYISANWSVEDLKEMEKDITAGNDLKMIYQGKFGLEQ